MMQTARTIGTTIARPLDEVYGFLLRPQSFARWASGLGHGLVARDGRWFTHTPEGEVEVRFTPDNPFGVLDHRVLLPAGEIAVPMRVVANGGGVEVLVTVFRRPGMDDDRFAADCAWVARDLAALKALLEAGGDR